MKITDLEDGANIATKLDLRELRVDLIERLQKIDARLNRLEWLLWLPVLSSAAQIVVTLVKH